MKEIVVNRLHIMALDKIYANLGYKILHSVEYPDGDTVIQIRVTDGRDYMNNVILGNNNGLYYVYQSYAIDESAMGCECLARWLDSAA